MAQDPDFGVSFNICKSFTIYCVMMQGTRARLTLSSAFQARVPLAAVSRARSLRHGKLIALAENESQKQADASGRAPSEASTSSPSGGLSAEEMEKLAEMRRLAKEKLESSKKGFLETALDEARLIDWPTPGKAVVQTLIVYFILIVSTALLFGMNVGLNAVFSNV